MDDELLKKIQKEQEENNKKQKEQEEKQKKHKQNVKALHSMFPNYTRDEIISVYVFKRKNFDRSLDALLNPNILNDIEKEKKEQEEKLKQEEELQKKKKLEEKLEQEKLLEFDKRMEDLYKEDMTVSKIASLLPGYSYEKIRSVLRIEKGNLEQTIKILLTPIQKKQALKSTDISEITLEKDENKEDLEEMLKIDEYFQKIAIYEESDDSEDELEDIEIIEEMDILKDLDFAKVIELEKEKEKEVADILMEGTVTQDFILQILETDLSNYDEDMEIIEELTTKESSEDDSKSTTKEVKLKEKISPVSKREILEDLAKRFKNNKHDWRFEFVVKKELLDKFIKKKKQLNCDPIIGYHGSAPQNITSICEKGLLVPGTKGFNHATDTGYYGRGIYLSPDAGMSISYCRGGGSLIVCAVLMGKTYKCPGLMMGASLQPGYHSHISPQGDELVLFNASQVLPLYVIHFSPKDLVKQLFGTHYYVEKPKKPTKDKKEKFTKKLGKHKKHKK